MDNIISPTHNSVLLNNNNNEESSNSLSVEQNFGSIFNFISLVVAILENLESKSDDYSTISQLVTELKQRIEKAKTFVKELPGTNLSQEQQIKVYNKLQQELITKQEIIQKYMGLIEGLSIDVD